MSVSKGTLKEGTEICEYYTIRSHQKWILFI